MKEPLKSMFGFFLRFGLSAILLGWLFSKIDYVHTWEAVKQSDLRYMAAAFIVFFSINFIILWRWELLMHAVGLKVGHLSAMRWFFIGLFYNLCLPTSVGGDVVKGLGLAKVTGDRPKVFASIVLDRLTGFAGIVILAATALFFGRGIVQHHGVVLAILAMTAVSASLAIVLFSHRIFSFVCGLFARLPKVRDALMNMHEDILLLKGRQRLAWEALGLSIAAQIVLAGVFYLTAKGMHQDIDLMYFIIFSPIVCVVTALPSIGGLGVREIGWVSLLSTVGVRDSVATGLSLVNFGFMVMVGLLGGLFYVVTLSSGRIQHHPPGSGVGKRQS